MALIFTVFCGLAATSLGYFINYFAKGHFVHNTEAILDMQLSLVEAVGIAQASKQPNSFYTFLDAEGHIPNTLPESVSSLSEGIILFDHPETQQNLAAKIHVLADGKRLLIATDITKTAEDFKFMQWLGIASIVFVILVVFVSYIISVFVVTGTNNIADTAREIIKTGDLSRRLTVSSKWDDLGNMANVLNLLLDRVESSMNGVKQVSDNIAHDLRLPLTRTRNKIESMEQSETKDLVLAEFEQILSTFNALLRISRIETEQQRSQFSTFELHGLLADVVDLYQPLAEEKFIKLSINLIDCRYYGDRDLLFQAYANLLDNAIKYTPEQGQVSVALTKGEHIQVQISDSGSGVSEAELEKIFDRFYRTDASRSNSGSGLGLSLVKAVMQLHHGNIEVNNTHQGFEIITNL